MSSVFVLDTKRQPLNPVPPGRARILLSSGKAAVLKRYPFTIVLKIAVEQPTVEPLRLKLDPGSKTTGIALLSDQSGQIAFAAELLHRGHVIKTNLASRRKVRHSRRRRKTRYRKPRFSNKCNQKKGTHDIAVFLKKKPELLQKILAQAKAPLKDAAAVNTTRWVLLERLKKLDLPVECGRGGLTKFNRTMRGLAKTHWLDAACVGKSTPETIDAEGIRPLRIEATGHGCRQMCSMDKYGFPRTGPKAAKRMKGYQTGDLVRAVVPEPLKTAGTHIGQLVVHATGSFDITSGAGRRIAGVSYQYCRPIHRSDGYSYTRGEAYERGTPTGGMADTTTQSA